MKSINYGHRHDRSLRTSDCSARVGSGSVKAFARNLTGSPDRPEMAGRAPRQTPSEIKRFSAPLPRPPDALPPYQYLHDWYNHPHFCQIRRCESVCHFMNCFLDSDCPPCIHSKKGFCAGRTAFLASNREPRVLGDCRYSIFPTVANGEAHEQAVDEISRGRAGLAEFDAVCKRCRRWSGRKEIRLFRRWTEPSLCRGAEQGVQRG